MAQDLRTGFLGSWHKNSCACKQMCATKLSHSVIRFVYYSTKNIVKEHLYEHSFHLFYSILIPRFPLLQCICRHVWCWV